jgi:hypothetical protein
MANTGMYSFMPRALYPMKEPQYPLDSNLDGPKIWTISFGEE